MDILSDELTIDPAKIEAAITSHTSAILAIHVYGIPCDVEAIQTIADKHGLKVIYDAAHSFGVKVKGDQPLNMEIISTTNFHATRIFHTVEAGSVITDSAELTKKLTLLRNSGYAGPYEFDGMGIEGKNSEFHAALGLSVLLYISDILSNRELQSERYK